MPVDKVVSFTARTLQLKLPSTMVQVSIPVRRVESLLKTCCEPVKSLPSNRDHRPTHRIAHQMSGPSDTEVTTQDSGCVASHPLPMGRQAISCYAGIAGESLCSVELGCQAGQPAQVIIVIVTEAF